MPAHISLVHPQDVVIVGGHLFIEPESAEARPWRATVTHLTEGLMMLAVIGPIEVSDIPVGAWLKCHYAEGATVIEFRSLVVEVVDGHTVRMTMRPREATPRTDRRRHRRVPVSAPARLASHTPGSVRLPAVVEDISIGGVRLSWTGHLSEGDSFEIEIDLPTGPVLATGVTVGTDRRGSREVVRAFFVKLDPASKTAIRDLLRVTPET